MVLPEEKNGQGESAFLHRDLGITSKIFPQSNATSSLPECVPHNCQPDLHPTMPSLGQEVANPSSSWSRELAPTITRVDPFGNIMNTTNNNLDILNIDSYSNNHINKVCSELESLNTPEISNDTEIGYPLNNYENIGSPEIVSFSINEELNPHDEEMPYSEDMEHQNNSHMKDILEPSLEDFSNGDIKNIYIAPSPVSPTHSDEEIIAYVNDLAENGGNDLFDSDLIPSPTTIVSTLDIFNTNPNDRSQNNQSMYADQNIKQHQYVPEYPNNELDHHDITLNKEIREDNNVSSIQYEQDQTPINNLEVDHDDYNMRNQYQQLKAPNEWYNENEINQNKTSILCIPDSVDLPTSNDQIEIIVDEAPDCIVPQKKPISMGVQSQTSAQKIVIVTKRESINPQAYQNDAQASWNIEHSGSNDCASSLSDLTSNPETGTCSADMVEPLASTSGEIERSRRSRQSLEGMSYKEKHLRMREQNNKASQKCRKKKKMEVEELFQSVGPLERRNQELRALLRKLELEKKKLLDHLKRTR